MKILHLIHLMNKIKVMRNTKDDKFSYTLGITLTFELLLHKSDKAIAIYIHSKYNGESLEKLLLLAKEKKIEVIYSDKIFNILSQKENCFVIGKFLRYESSLEEGNHIVLVNPGNAGNVGTIIRSLVGFGFKNLAIISPGVDVFDTKTVRSSMGSIFSINFEYFSSFEQYQKKYNNNMYPFMLKAKTKLQETTFKCPYSLIFGNEATGLPDEFLKYHSVIISHSNKIDSLNITMAVSIACYEATKENF